MTGIERLRALAGAWDEWGLGGSLTEIADEIERELVRHDEPDSTDNGTRLLCVTDEDREALEWVRKYGGIGCVQTMAATLGDTLNWIRERVGIGEDEVVDYDELLDALDRRLGGTLAEIADQIERERACDADAIENIRLIVGGVVADMERHCLGHEGMEDSPVARWARELREALGGDEHDHADEREAVAWVRDHGGLDIVKKLLDWVIGHCSTKQQLDFDFWLSGRVMYELGFDEDMADREEVERRLLARLMPEGMEWLIEVWPKFEDDAPVKLGDMALIDGDVDMVEAVQIWIHGKPVIYGDNGSQQLEKGERVKRPAVLAADGEPLEVGQTVWDVESGEELKVKELCDVGLVQLLTRDGVSRYVYPDDLTHQRPVLDADGVPIKVGEHVWDDHGEELVVLGLSGGLVRCRFNGETCIDSVDDDKWEPSQLTHERPDSWERIEEDAGCTATKYNERRGTIFTTKQQVARDLVRRCRALAERERGE